MSDTTSSSSDPDPSGRPFVHVPVLLDEVVAALGPVPPGWVVDGTVGGAGHAVALLDAHPHLSLLGLDRDPDAVSVASDRLARFGPRAHVVHARFDQIDHAMSLLSRHRRTLAERDDDVGARDRADGEVPWGDERLTAVLLDLGVSSPQLDRPERGFSFRFPGPLDMRMDQTGDRATAADLVNEAEETELARILRRFGDERHAARIAAAIVAARPLRTTEELADVVRSAVPAPARRTGGDPATRSFQALRIAVNDELEQLDAAIGDALDLLVPGGRVAAITYHSGEDRIVARRFRDAAADNCLCPPGTGACRCGGAPSVKLVPRRAIRPGDEEVADNRRSRSARLRVAQRLHEAS